MRIVIDHVTKTIKGAVILDDVSLTLRSGTVYGLQGVNGSGKTMLMRLIAGLIRPTSGKVTIDGKILGKDLDFPGSMGLLIENPAFLDGHTGLKNLELLAQIKGEIGLPQIKETLREVGLKPEDPRKFKKSSLGMKQRLGIAAALMEKPDLILLDEPTNALDDRGVARICALIRRERERGALIVLACHDASILEGLADEIYKISEGKIEKRAAR